MGRGTYEKVLTFGAWPYGRFRVLVISSTLDPGEDSLVQVVGSIDKACDVLDHENATSVYVDGARSSASYSVVA